MSKRTIQIEVEIDDSNQDVMKAIKNRVKWTAVRTDFYKPSNYGPLEISMNIEATAPRNEEKKENPNWKDTKRYVGEETREEVACGKCLRKFIDGDKHICKTEDKLQGVTINGITYPHSSMLSDWAKFVAMDGDTGDWYEYSVKPEKDHPIWDCPVSKRTSALSHEAKTNEEKHGKSQKHQRPRKPQRGVFGVQQSGGGDVLCCCCCGFQWTDPFGQQFWTVTPAGVCHDSGGA